MSNQIAYLEELWNLEEEELERILAEDEKLIELEEEEVKKVDRAVIEEMQKQEPLFPTLYQPKPPPRPKRKRRTRQIQTEFEPARRWVSRDQPGTLNELKDLYGDVEREGEEKRGRRFIKWTIIKDLEKDQTPNFMEKIRRNARTAFYMKYSFDVVLRNLEDGRKIVYRVNKKGSPWMKTFKEAESRLKEKEAGRLDKDEEGPSTKWGFDEFFKVEVKIVLDKNSPLLGTGRLPDWLRNLAHSRVMVTLDTYQDNLCLWRCLAVHQGSRPDRCERAKLQKKWQKAISITRKPLQIFQKYQ